MLRIAVAVNDLPIDNMYIHNTGDTVDGKWYLYDAATWDGFDGTFGIENVWHERTQPWYMLVAKCALRVKRAEHGRGGKEWQN